MASSSAIWLSGDRIRFSYFWDTVPASVDLSGVDLSVWSALKFDCEVIGYSNTADYWKTEVKGFDAGGVQLFYQIQEGRGTSA